MSRRIHFSTWGRRVDRVTIASYAIERDGRYGIDAVVASIERSSGLCVCGGPRWDGDNCERGRRVASHYQITLGRPCSGGGYTPVAGLWVSIPTGGAA
jgi:hypothetical protein